MSETEESGVRAALVALLPMKANSERVPRKNFRLLHGKPLFRWILDRLLEIEAVERVVINTDSEALLAGDMLPETPRLLVRRRRPEICGDFVSMNRVLEDDLAAVPADCYLMTHATNPLLSTTTMTEAIECYRAGLATGEIDSLFGVNRYQSRFYHQDGTPVNHDPAVLLRTQDLPPLFEENSTLYLFSPASFQATGARIGSRPLLFPIPRVEAVDIDDASDWDLADALLAGLSRVDS